MKKIITIVLIAIILLSCGLAAVMRFYPDLIPQKFDDVSEFKVLLPALGPSSILSKHHLFFESYVEIS